MTGIKINKLFQRHALVLIFILFAAAYSEPEDSGPITAMPGNNNEIGFRQEFNTYIWNYNFTTMQVINNRWQVLLNEKFTSSMLKLSSDNDKWKDDQNLNFKLGYSLLPTVTLHSRLSSLLFMDRQSGFNNDIRTHHGNFGIEYTPLPNLRFFAQAGPKWDSRFSRDDKGYNYYFEASAEKFAWEKYENNLNVLLGQDQFSQRQNKDLNIQYTMYREFAPGTSDSLRLLTTNQRRDNYTSTSGNIESLRENVKGLDNVLFYNISRNLNIQLNSGLYFKDVQILSSVDNIEEKRRNRSDQRLSQDALFYLRRNRLKSQLQLSWWTQKQSYDIDTDTSSPFSGRTAFITPDNESSRLMMVAGLSTPVTKKDSLYSYISISKFQYDTPDTSNFDDRDELRFNSRLIGVHRFSPVLRGELQASVNLYHLVYIFGERSADNNWNRIFLLRPSVNYTPVKTFKFTQAFEVLANYVDYDFEDKSVQTKSFVFRKFSMDDSLQFQVTHNSTLSFDYRLQLEENGQLSWDEWTERVLATRRNQWIHFIWNYQPTPGFRIGPGYSCFFRQEWRHELNSTGLEKKTATGVYTSQGPVLRLFYSPTPRLRFVFDAIRYRVKPQDGEKYYINNIQLLLNWVF
ncbi:MAG TPA: hypothetical protein PLP19_19935 [bacterium]|nr:hypothetical protein [bacterium]HPN45766.1 hypothetical protein [bacterium]